MTVTETGPVCQREGCTAFDGGPCSAGHSDPRMCPEVVQAGKESTPSVDRAGVSDDRIALHQGTELDARSVSAVTRSAWTRLIVVAGAEDSGKTTLLATVYECLLTGPLAGYSCAASLTLPAFERICHDSRIASNRDEGVTTRTPRGDERRYLHLVVRRSRGMPLYPLVLLDLAGEQYRLAMDSEQECRKLDLLRRADHVALLIDGAKISNIGTRANAYHDARRLLRSFVDAGMVGGTTIVDVVFSKWDFVDGDAPAVGFAEQAEAEIRQRFSELVGTIRVHRVAARPAPRSLTFAYNVEELFRSWVEETRFMERTESDLDVVRPTSGEFDLFDSRHFRGGGSGE